MTYADVVAAPETVLQFDSVNRVYGQVTALANVSFTINAGELAAVLGPSGSGKTTLLHLAGALDRPTSGRVFVSGAELSRMSDRELSALRCHRIGFVFQQFFLAPHRSALDNVSDGLVYAGVPRSERRERAREALVLVGLSKRLAHRPGQLSGGEKQRVAIARAIAGEPGLLLADEPTGALDSANGEHVVDLLHELNAAGTTIVVITHDHDVASHFRRQIQVRDGAIISDVGGQA